jgi:tetratricopeptide (TPR) repeat protein
VAIATRVLNQATSRFPADGLIRLGAADLAIVNGNDSEAAAIMAQAAGLARTSPDPVELVSVLGRICGFQTVNLQYQQALASCQQAAQQAAATGQDPSGAFDNLSAVEAGLGQLQPAIANLTSAIGAFQGNVGTDAQPAGVDGFGLAFLYEARGRLLIEDHETQMAISDYRQALASLPSGLPDFSARLRSDIAAARHD